jgi:hypothetical protein
MKRLLVILVLLGTASVGNAAFDHRGWKWQRSIPVEAPSGFVRLSIIPEILDQSQATLNDLRVLDGNNNLVPHVIHWGRVRESKHMEWLAAQLLNETFIPQQHTRVTLDFQEMLEKNRVKVALSETNYRRRALLEGSNDSLTWEIVAENLWFFDVRLQGRKFTLDTLTFPRNNFRYLRLTVYNMADDPRRITIESAKAAFYRTESKKELMEVPVTESHVSFDQKKKQSIFELDMGYRNLPVVVMVLEFDTRFFYRGYELVGRNQAVEKVRRKTENGWKTIEQKVPWKKVSTGVLYRTRYHNKTSAALTLEGLKAPYRYLQLRIFNGDNPPLQLRRTRLFRRETSLVFQATSQQNYTLIGGNAKVRPPDYDLAKAVRGVDEFKLPMVHSGLAEMLSPPAEKTLPWSERHAGLILIVLAAAVGVMLVFIMKNLKSLPGKDRRQ